MRALNPVQRRGSTRLRKRYAAQAASSAFFRRTPQSRWVREELDFAEAHGKQIFLVLARGHQDDAVPFGFSTHQWVDIRREYAPVKQELIPAIHNHLRETPNAQPTAATHLQPAQTASAQKPRSWRLAVIGFVAIVGVIAVLVFLVPQNALQVPSTQILPTSSAALTIAPNDDSTLTVQLFDEVEIVLVPSGCFMMGTSTGLGDISQCVEQPFWIDRTEVTMGDFRRLDGSTARQADGVGGSYPRSYINWFEARDFCAEKRGGLLPTELEWQYAAR